MNEEEKKDRKKKIIKVVKALVIVATLLLIVNIGNIKSAIADAKNRQNELTNKDFIDEDEIENQLSTEQSDIDGMTKYDKFEEGLNTDDGADSDWDGLTDKEEIEKYHTDPKKVSTSGDLYSDGYKVAHNMDLTKKYDYKNDLTFENNSCPEVVLTAEKARDFNCFVNDLTGSGMYDLTGKNVIKEYSVSLFSGKFAVDLSMIENAPVVDDIKVYVQADGDAEAKAVKYDTDGKDGNIITLKKDFEYGQHYVIYITKVTGGFITSRLSSQKSSKATVVYGNMEQDLQDMEGVCGVMCGCPFISETVCIYYRDDLGEAGKNEVVNALHPIAEDLASERIFTHFSEENIVPVSKSWLNAIAKLSELIPADRCRWEGDILKYGPIYAYSVYRTGDGTDAGNGADAADDTMSADAGGEDSSSDDGNGNETMYSVKYSDRFPFANFATEMSPNGVCAGITHITTMVHNRGSVMDPVKDFTFNNNKYSYDITQDPENQTLMNIGLHDYKDAHFVETHRDKRGLVTENLTDGEQSFVNMVNYYWAKQNSVASDPKYFKGMDASDNDDLTTRLYYDGTVVRNIISELDKGNYVDANFILNDGSGHAVNITGYDKVAENKYVFYVYDSNYPTETGTLTCEINKTEDGKEFLNYLLVINNASYTASPDSGYKTGNHSKLSAFIAVDTDFNVLN